MFVRTKGESNWVQCFWKCYSSFQRCSESFSSGLCAVKFFQTRLNHFCLGLTFCTRTLSRWNTKDGGVVTSLEAQNFLECHCVALRFVFTGITVMDKPTRGRPHTFAVILELQSFSQMHIIDVLLLLVKFKRVLLTE